MTNRIVKAATSAFAVFTLVAGSVVAAPPGASAATAFHDVPASHEHRSHIEWLAERGIARGYSDGTFHPSESVSRAAFAAFLYRMAGISDYSPPASSPFRDVAATHPFYKEISWLASVGVTTGWEVPGGKEFRPEAKIARDAMAAFMYRYACSPAYAAPAVSPFGDVSAGRVFYKEIAWMRATGLSTGWSDNTYRPMNNTERAAIAAFLHRYADKGFYSQPRCPVTIHAQDVTFADKDGKANDTFTVPRQTGVQYKVNGKEIQAGTYKVADCFAYSNHAASAVVTANPTRGYLLAGTTSWKKMFDGVETVSAKAVTFSDENGKEGDVFAVPSQTGVRYRVDGEDVDSGTYRVRDYFAYDAEHRAAAKVTAVAEDGYRLSGAAEWAKTFDGITTLVAPAVTFTDQDGKSSDYFSIPSQTGVEYRIGGERVDQGSHLVENYALYIDWWASPAITAVAQDGYRIEGTASWTQKIDGRVETTPAGVSFTDEDGMARDTIEVPDDARVAYYAGDRELPVGSPKVVDFYAYTDYVAQATVTAIPRAGYKFATGATTTWSQAIDGHAQASAQAPSFSDASGKKADTYTIPDVEGVQYVVNGENAEPGTWTVTTHGTDGAATVTVTVTARAGYRLTNPDAGWSGSYTAIVTPEEVMFDDPNGLDSDTVTIPDLEGVYYTVDGVRLVPGTHQVSSQIGAYSSHHREMSVHAYADDGYTMDGTAQVYYFHKFTDGQQATARRAKRSPSDYGTCTVAQAKAQTEQFHRDLASEIENGSDYGFRTTIGDLYGVTDESETFPVTPTSLDDRTREVNRRYALRYQERTDAFRALCGLETIELANLTPEAEELLYQHAVQTWVLTDNGTNPGHHMDEPAIVAAKARNANGRGEDFDGTYDVGENLYFNYGGKFDMTPEEVADKSFAAYLGEYPYLDGTFNHDNGHLVNLLGDKYTVHANYMYIADFSRNEWGRTCVNGTCHPNYLSRMKIISVQTPGASSYR